MRAGAFNFWADNALRGKVLRIDSTNRVDLIDSAMRRSGRTDIKIPILMPDTVATDAAHWQKVIKQMGLQLD